MMKLTDNFDESEFFTETSGTPTTLQRGSALALCQTVLQPARNAFGKSIKINSGMRSLIHNAAIGGAKTSEHLYKLDSAAADIDTGNDADNRRLFDILLGFNLGIGQLIVYITKSGIVEWIHVSKRSQAKPTPEIMCATAEQPTRYKRYDGKIERP